MLTSRGVTRLSRRAVNNAKKTNAFFSTAAAAPILTRAVLASPASQRAFQRPARVPVQAGQFYFVFGIFEAQTFLRRVVWVAFFVFFHVVVEARVLPVIFRTQRARTLPSRRSPSAM